MGEPALPMGSATLKQVVKDIETNVHSGLKELAHLCAWDYYGFGGTNEEKIALYHELTKHFAKWINDNPWGLPGIANHVALKKIIRGWFTKKLGVLYIAVFWGLFPIPTIALFTIALRYGLDDIAQTLKISYIRPKNPKFKGVETMSGKDQLTFGGKRFAAMYGGALNHLRRLEKMSVEGYTKSLQSSQRQLAHEAEEGAREGGDRGGLAAHTQLSEEDLANIEWNLPIAPPTPSPPNNPTLGGTDMMAGTSGAASVDSTFHSTAGDSWSQRNLWPHSESTPSMQPSPHLSPTPFPAASESCNAMPSRHNLNFGQWAGGDIGAWSENLPYYNTEQFQVEQAYDSNAPQAGSSRGPGTLQGAHWDSWDTQMTPQ